MSSFKILTIVLMFTELVLAQTQQIQGKALSAIEIQKKNHAIVKMVSRKLSMHLPQAVDQYTALVKVDGVNSTLIYTYEINTGNKSDQEVREKDKSHMKKAVISTICQYNKDFLDTGITIIYIYKNITTKRELFRFTVTQSECSKDK